MQSEQEVTGGTLMKALTIAGHTVVFRLRASDEPERPGIEYTLFARRPLPPEVKRAVLERISFFLSLEDDLAPFYELASADPQFAPIVERLYGLHHVKFLTLCEAACWSVLTQRIAIPVARKMKRALVEMYGERLEVEGRTYYAFPELERLAQVSPVEFAALLKNERRATYLYNVIQGLREIDETYLRTAPYAEAEARLLAIKGIGTWSASLMLLRALGRMDYVQSETLAVKPLQLAVAQFYGPGANVAELAAHYGRYVGYWLYYLRSAS